MTTTIRRLSGLAFGLMAACGTSEPTGQSPGTPTATSTTTSPTSTTTTTAPTGSTNPDGGGNPPPPDSGLPVLDGGNPPTPGTVGIGGIAAWDALPTAEKNKVLSFRSVFFHQSVGQDLEYGASVNGFKFEYTEPGASLMANAKQGPYGGLAGSNGTPTSKTSAMTGFVNRNSALIKVAILKFGYADVVASNLSTAQTAYAAMVADIKSKGVRVLHVTPPFVYNVPAENAPKMQMRTWMTTTFPNDVIFDLEDVESTEPTTGARCERGGSWEICDSIRSKPGCASESQGADAPSGQGHICKTTVPRVSKAFLYAIYQAGK
jgi:hypothetical protein